MLENIFDNQIVAISVTQTTADLLNSYRKFSELLNDFSLQGGATMAFAFNMPHDSELHQVNITHSIFKGHFEVSVNHRKVGCFSSIEKVEAFLDNYLKTTQLCVQ